METSDGTRCSSRKREIVQVSFYGRCDVKGKFISFAKGDGLKPFDGEGSINPGSMTEDKIVSVNPWSEKQKKMPTGYLKDWVLSTVGSTEIWVQYWHLPPRTTWFNKRSGYGEDFLEVSCLTWHYRLVGDYETSLFVEIHSYVGSSLSKQHEQAAEKLAADMREFLNKNPASPESVQKRLDENRARQERWEGAAAALQTRRESRPAIPSPNKKVFEQGTHFDFFSTISNLFKSARTQLMVVDNYIDESLLNMLSPLAATVRVRILTLRPPALFQTALQKFSQQYPDRMIEVRIHSGDIHDRFLIIDEERFYNIGSSIKDAGSKLSTINAINGLTDIKTLRAAVAAGWASSLALSAEADTGRKRSKRQQGKPH